MAIIKELKTDFTGVGQVRGFKFTQLRKTNSAYLYSIDTGDRIYYEVFRKRINDRYGCVSYPTDKAFGIWAWTTPNIDHAYKKLNELSMEHSSVSTIHKTDIKLPTQSELPKKFCV